MENRNSHATRPDDPSLSYSYDDIIAALDDLDANGLAASLDSDRTPQDPALQLINKIGAKIIDLDQRPDYTQDSSMPLFIEPKVSSDQEVWDSYSDNIVTPPAQPVQNRSSSDYRVRKRQFDAERTYDDIIELDLAEAGAQLTPEEIHERMDVDHVVKRAPKFTDQVDDSSRTNIVTFIGNTTHSHVTGTSSDGLRDQRQSMTEHEALQGLQAFLDDIIEEGSDELRGVRAEAAHFAESLRDRLSFIGEKEYKEATAGIATYWKECLEENPKLRIFTTAGMIGGTGSEIKSDANLFDNILAHFSDEELQRYAGRLFNDESLLTDDVENTKVVLLDDWTISGTQLLEVTDKFLDGQRKHHRDFSGHVELQLIIASEGRIRRGTIDKPSLSTPHQPSSMIPVRAYYVAHDAYIADGESLADNSDTHITGSHSSVDYDFETEISEFVAKLNKFNREHGNNKKYQMPPLTNIVRPYRRAEGNTLDNIARLQAVTPTSPAAVPVTVAHPVHSIEIDDPEDYEWFEGEE